MNTQSTQVKRETSWIEVHHFLQRQYEKMMTTKNEFEKRGLKIKLGFFNNHYVMIENKWEHQGYAIPLLDIEGRDCAIGFNLDKIFFEFSSIDKVRVNEAMLVSLISKFSSFSIYGVKDYFNEFYFPHLQPSEIVRCIHASDETMVQMSMYFDYNDPDIVKHFVAALDIVSGCDYTRFVNEGH